MIYVSICYTVCHYFVIKGNLIYSCLKSYYFFFKECEEQNFGENCSQICTCGQGMDRCDPVSGCVCKSGWTGLNCMVDINECENETICENEKVCQNFEGSYQCNCRVGFKRNGDFCEGKFIFLLFYIF